MCGRYSILTEDEIIQIREVIQEQEISMRMMVSDDFEDYTNTATEMRPTDKAPVIVGHSDGVVSFQDLRWGFRKWDGKGVIINARAETLKTQRLFAPLLTAGRCVVPAREYYEWERQGRTKQKYFIKDAAGHLLFMAGLYRDTPEGREFVIITKEACGSAADIHGRMPVMLRANQIEDWLKGTLSPDDIVQLEFNVNVTPCDDEYVQLRLFD